jgi:alpha,alpha-trehalase
VLELTDCMTLRSGTDFGELVASGRGELPRLARVVSGAVEVQVRLVPLDPIQVGREAGPGGSGGPGRTCTSCCGAPTSST